MESFFVWSVFLFGEFYVWRVFCVWRVFLLREFMNDTVLRHLHIYACLRTCLYVHMCIYIYIYLCVYIHVNVKVYIYFFCFSPAVLYRQACVRWGPGGSGEPLSLPGPGGGELLFREGVPACAIENASA